MTALDRIAAALERLAPQPLPAPDFGAAEAFVWHVGPDRLDPVARVSRIDVGLLVGIDRSRDTLLANTRHFAQGLPANNALLWGARGMGKSSLVKAIHAQVRGEGHDLKIVELSREDLPSVQRLLSHLRAAPCRFILFCDDLSFANDDQHYKSLKAVLDGGIEGRPENVLFYATSNRRHLMPREIIENERSSAINPGEAVEEKVSLSDRFGLWPNRGLRTLLQRHVMKARLAEHPERFEAASPIARVHAGAPPFLVVHGDLDTLVPVREARAFVAALRAVSRETVIYAEIPGAQHAFEVFPSMRTELVLAGVERFAEVLRRRAVPALAPDVASGEA